MISRRPPPSPTCRRATPLQGRDDPERRRRVRAASGAFFINRGSNRPVDGRFVAVLVSALLAGSVALLVNSAHEPVFPQEECGLYVDGTGPPTTILAMKAEADAVVLGTYWRQRRSERRSALKQKRQILLPESPFTFNSEPPPEIPTSIHLFEIHELLKSHTLLRDRLELNLIGGVEETSSRMSRNDVCGRRHLIPRHRYVVFTRHVRGRWIPACGQDGGSTSIYDVSSEQAISLSEADLTPSQRSRAFIEELRK